ncbi:hypothetical protein SDC9_71735 [bioreactor metagenome]|uniref:Uncharacterized protein n=1 Tax=bioreactor metagenome TaxID=1076179 RepID=A0A644Y9L6_9ZZZZ
MHNIHIFVEDKLTKVVIEADVVFYQGCGLVKVVLIDIAHGYNARLVIRNVSATHSAYADNTFCQFIAGCDKPFPQYISGNHSEKRYPTEGF